MRILHVSPTYAPCIGGSERLLQHVSERLAARGHEVMVLTFDCASQRDFRSATGAGLSSKERLNGVEVLRISPGSGIPGRVHRWWLRRRGGHRSTRWLFRSMGYHLDADDAAYAVGMPMGMGAMLPLLRQKADVLCSINWGFGISFWAHLAARMMGLPHVAVPVLHIDRPWAHKKVYSRMLASCDAAIACTDAEAVFMKARGAKAVTVAGAGVEPGRFAQKDGAAIRARHGLGGRPVVGFIGRQDLLKGVPTLINAMRVVWQRQPDSLLLLAGPRAHRDRAVSETLDSLAPAKRARVVLIDDFADEELASILDACDLVALPSVEEAFGLVLIEAWTCGKPVIGADIAATRCIIDDGVNGLIVRPFDATDLASKILDLLADPAKRVAFGERGRAKVLSRYTWDRVTDAWEATLRNVLARP